MAGFMLDVNRLLASELVALGKPEECWAAMMLWCRAWQQHPPASLPNDDRVLAAFSGAGVRWSKVKQMAMRSFVLCSDNRWYHPVLVEEVNNAWKKREAYRADQERLKNWRQAQREKREGNGTANAPGNTNETDLKRVSQPVSSGVSEPVDRDSTGTGTLLHTSSLRLDGGKPPEPEIPQDPKAELWREGLAILCRLTNQPNGPARKLLGKMLDAAVADHAALLAILRQAEVHQPDDPVAWIKGAINQRNGAPLLATASAAPDPWGIGAWTARQPNAKPTFDGRTNRKKPAINGFFPDVLAEVIAEAAGLPETWRGKWDAMGDWMRDDVDITDGVLSAITEQATRMRAQGQTIGSMQVFDATVRGAAARRDL
jgi:hypothetical protein